MQGRSKISDPGKGGCPSSYAVSLILGHAAHHLRDQHRPCAAHACWRGSRRGRPCAQPMPAPAVAASTGKRHWRQRSAANREALQEACASLGTWRRQLEPRGHGEESSLALVGPARSPQTPPCARQPGAEAATCCEPTPGLAAVRWAASTPTSPTSEGRVLAERSWRRSSAKAWASKAGWPRAL